MKVEILIKVSAESREELVGSFAGNYRELRAHIEKLQASGILPVEPAIRWLLKSGEQEPPIAHQPPPVVTGT